MIKSIVAGTVAAFGGAFISILNLGNLLSLGIYLLDVTIFLTYGIILNKNTKKKTLEEFKSKYPKIDTDIDINELTEKIDSYDKEFDNYNINTSETIKSLNEMRYEALSSLSREDQLKILNEEKSFLESYITNLDEEEKVKKKELKK